jgi:hypothetical protein
MNADEALVEVQKMVQNQKEVGTKIPTVGRPVAVAITERFIMDEKYAERRAAREHNVKIAQDNVHRAEALLGQKQKLIDAPIALEE